MLQYLLRGDAVSPMVPDAATQAVALVAVFYRSWMGAFESAALSEWMQNNSLVGDWFINDFHRKNSMAAQREVQQMSLHPCSREQKLAQIAVIRHHSAITKKNANLERSKRK